MKPEININNTSVGVDDNIQFSDIFELEDIQKIQNLFSNATGVASIITFPDGTPITIPSNFTRLCNDVIRKTEKGCANCFKSDEILGRPNTTGPIVQPCLSGGLWDAGASITVGGKHIANWLIGQVSNENLDEQSMIAYADSIGADKVEFMSALSEVPVMASDKFEKIAELLFVYAKQISEKAYVNLQLKKQIEEQKKANELLLKSEEYLSITLNSIGDGVISTDINGLIVSMNPVALHLCGWSLFEAQGRPLTEVFNIVNVDTRKPVVNPIYNVLKTGQIVELANHTSLISKSGEEYQIADSAAPIRNAEGDTIGVVLVFSDVTEKYKSEYALRESERSKSVLLTNLPGMSYRCLNDHDWTMKFVSDGCLELTGYEMDDLIDSKTITFNDIIKLEYQDNLREKWDYAILHHEKVTEEYEIITSENIVKWVWEQGIPIYNDLGEVIALEGLILDITERKLAEENLQNERLLLRTIIDNIPIIIYAKDLESRKTLANKAEVNILGGKSEADVLGKDDFDLYPQELAQKFYNDDQQVFQTGKPILNNEELIVDKEGNQRWMLYSKILLCDKENNTIGLLGISNDITNRKSMEESMRLSEEKYRNIFNNVQDVFFQVDFSGKIIELSPSIKYFSEFKRDELIGTDVNDIYADFHERESFLKAIVEFGELSDYEIGLKTKTGVVKIVSLNVRLTRDTEGNPVLIDGSLRDITRRKQIEEALRDSEIKYRELIDNSPDAIVIYVDGKIVFVNKESVHLMRATSTDELIGKSVIDFIHPDSQAFIVKRMKMAILEGTILPPAEEKFIRLDGSEIIVEVKTMSIKLDNTPAVQLIVRDVTERKRVDDMLKKSRTEFKELFDFAPIGYHEIDTEGRIVRINETETYMLGYTEDELLGQYVWKLFADENFSQEVAKSKLTGKLKPLKTYESEFRRKNGTTFSVLISDIILKTNDGVITGIRSTIQDITQLKLAENAKRESDFKFRNYIDFAPHGVLVINNELQFVETNSALSKISGYSLSELLKLVVFDLLSDESVDEFHNHSNKVKHTGFASDEFTIVRKDKSKAYVSIDTVKLYDDIFLAFVVDITDRKEAEVILKESEFFLKETQMIAKLGNCTIDMKSGTWQSSEILEIILGISSEFDNTINGLSTIIHPDFRKNVIDYFFNEIVFSRSGFNKKFKIVRQNDFEVRWVHTIGEFKYDSSNQLEKMIITVQDITERKQIAEELRASEALYRSVLSASPDIIAVIDLDGKIRMVSPAALQIYGGENVDELIGRNLDEFVIPDDRDRLKINFSRMFDEIVGTAEYSIVLADGSLFFAEVNGDIIRNEQREPTGVIIIIRNIGERKRVEAALSYSQEQLKKFAAHLQNVREEERIGLAREIHDELGQILIAIKIDIGILKQNVLKRLGGVTANDILTKFDQLFNLVDNTINTARKIMTDLRPEVLYLLGFIESAKLQTSNFQTRHHINCNFECSIDKLEVNTQQSVALYRILQEALTNVAKHSKATSVTVKLYFDADKLILEINDNGIGLDEVTKIKNDSYGLIGMKERVFLLDGELFISGLAGIGTNIKVEMPYFNE